MGGQRYEILICDDPEGSSFPTRLDAVRWVMEHCCAPADLLVQRSECSYANVAELAEIARKK